MDSRERTFLTLAHETPDRIPIDFWASKGMIRKLEARLGRAYSSMAYSFAASRSPASGPVSKLPVIV